MRGSWDVEAAMHSERSVVSSFPLFLAVRTLIIGEERRYRERVRSLLERTDEAEVAGEFESMAEALHSIEDEAVDLLLLDVEAPEMTGLGMLEARGERCPQIIFAAPPHAEELQRAIASHDLEHLTKPFSDERFYDALRRTCRRVLLERLGQPRTTHHRLSALLTELRGEAPSRADKLVVPEKGSSILHVIRLEDVDWIEAKDRGVQIHVGGETFWLRKTLAAVERQLDPDMFMRIHRCRIVNRTRITAVKWLWKGEYSVILANGRSVGAGRTYQPAVEGFLRAPGVRGKRRADREGCSASSAAAAAQPQRGGRSG